MSALEGRVAVIDIGTNTVLLTLAEREPASPVGSSSVHPPVGFRVLREEERMTRLGEGVDASGRLGAQAVRRTLACLRDYRELARAAGASEILVVGTSAVRDGALAGSFPSAVQELFGRPLEVLSGQREAALTFRGALTGTIPRCEGDASLGAFDIGGGSTELVVGAADGVVSEAVSVNVGSVRLRERAASRDLEEVNEMIVALLPSRRLEPPPAHLLGIAGTVATLWRLAHEGARFPEGAPLCTPEERFVLRRVDVELWARRLFLMTQVEREALVGVARGRADVIPFGALICAQVMKWFHKDECFVTQRGVRHGVLLEWARSGGASGKAGANRNRP